MPLQDFRCPECGYLDKDVLLSPKDFQELKDKMECPKCKEGGKTVMMKVKFGGRNRIQFKGSGFHATDYK